MEQTYQAKLDNIKLSSNQSDKAASARESREAREEIKEASIRLGSLINQFSGIRKQVSAAEDHICELEETLARERETSSARCWTLRTRR